MDKTNRDIINGFVPKLITDYAPQRIPAGAFTDEVPGYTGLLQYSAVKGQQTDLVIGNWDTPSADAQFPDNITVRVRPYRALTNMDQDAEDRYFDRGGLDWTIQVSSGDPILTIPLPQAVYPPGVWLVSVKYEDFFGSSRNTSVAQLLVVDDTAPFERSGVRPPALRLPAGVSNPLTRADFLSAPNQTLNLEIPYTAADGYSPDDQFEVRRNGVLLTFPPAGSRLPITLTTPPTVPFTLAMYDAAPGNFPITYQIIEVTGKASQESESLFLGDLSQVAAPTGFGPLTIDNAVPGDHQFDRREMGLATGLRARVPAIQNVLPTDTITVTLSGGAGGPFSITQTVNASTFPISFDFSEANLLALWGTGPGDVPITATYSLTRAGSVFPAAPLSVPFNLNLKQVGPNPNPNPPGANGVNNDLLPVVVQAIRSPGVFGPDNLLEIGDVNRDARAVIPYWTAPELIDTQLPVTFTVNYGGQLFPLTVTSIDPARQVVIPIPFSAVLNAGNGTVQVSYTVTSPGTSYSQRSPDTPVSVFSAVRLMDAPIVQGTVGYGTSRAVGCGSLVNGFLRVDIPASRYLSLAEQVRVTFTGYQNNTATGVALPPVVKSFSLPGVAAITTGFTVNLGTSTELFDPIHATRLLRTVGSATLTYETISGGATVGSRTTTILVRGVAPGQQGVSSYCSGVIIP